MGIELFQPVNIRSITANSSGTTSGYKMTLSGATTANANTTDLGAVGSAVSGPITSAFHLIGLVVKWDVAVHSGVTVSLLGRRGTTPVAFTGVSLASGVSTYRLSWKWFPRDLFVPASHTIQIWTGPNSTGTSSYIDALVRF